MQVKALRGVCIGVDRHLIAGDVEDLEPALVTFLVGIGAVEIIKNPPPPPPDEPSTEDDTTAKPARAGRKEK